MCLIEMGEGEYIDTGVRIIQTGNPEYRPAPMIPACRCVIDDDGNPRIICTSYIRNST